jgi:hypothetical protein
VRELPVAVFQATGNWTEEQRELDWLLMLDDLSVLLDGTTDAGWLVDVGLMLPLYSSIYLLGTLIIKILEYLCENERRAEGSAGAGKGLGQPPGPAIEVRGLYPAAPIFESLLYNINIPSLPNTNFFILFWDAFTSPAV